MSTALLSRPHQDGSNWPTFGPLSSVTSTVKEDVGVYPGYFVFPFGGRTLSLNVSTPVSGSSHLASTPTIRRERFELPLRLLADAIKEAASLAAAAPAEQTMLTDTTYQEGVALLRSLPVEVDMPEPVIEPSGTLAWLWDRGEAGFLVLAVDGTGRIQRSAVIEGKESWGNGPLAKSLAPEVLSLLGNFRVQHA